MLRMVPILIICVKLILGISIDANQRFSNVTIPNKVANVHASLTARSASVFEFEKCPFNKYHIHFRGPHQDPDKTKKIPPPATQCGHPQGSVHINFHWDRCIPNLTPLCNNCKFPFTTYNKWNRLRHQYLILVHNWHGFIYSSGTRKCFCLFDNITQKMHEVCIETDVRTALVAVVKALQDIAQAIWDGISNEPLEVKIAIMAVVVAALALLLSHLIAVAVAAGVAISAALVAEIAAIFGAAMMTAFHVGPG